MSNCSSEEIAEKRRLAIQKLKSQRNTEMNTKGMNTLGRNKDKPKLSAADLVRAASERTLEQKRLKDCQNRFHPYPKSLMDSFRSAESTLKVVTPAPVFNKTVTCVPSMISDKRFKVVTSGFHSALIDLFKTITSKSYDPNSKTWSFDINHYYDLKERMISLKPSVTIGDIPKNVLKLCSLPVQAPDSSCLFSLDPQLLNKLLPFQKEGVSFGISKQGRVLIADEMGLGKTYQALAIADFYKDDWPVLICTTASTKDSWVSKIREIMPYVACHHIVCLSSGQDYFGDPKILVTSYNMMEKSADKLMEKKFGVIILDESHTLKNSKAKCTAVADRLSGQAKRVILLTGTPALSRPVELFSQLRMLDRTYFNYIDYTTRYCEGKQSAFGWDASGQSNLEELKVVLFKKFMVRRLKAEVLPQLSEKNRETVYLDPSLVYIDEELKHEFDSYTQDISRSSGREKEEILLKFYAATASAKREAVCSYLRKLIKEKLKFLIFAHHQVMMDAICDCLTKLKVDHIRIDGSTKTDLRSAYVNKFQSKKTCTAAVLSIRACSAGITLTAANLILFAELDWNPSTLAQAESRAHRIGQEGVVTCRYLLAHNTADDLIWGMLKRKQEVLNKAGLFCENLQNTKHTAAPSSSKNIEEYFSKTPKKSFTSQPRYHSYPGKIVNPPKPSESSDEDLSNLLDEDDVHFHDLVW